MSTAYPTWKEITMLTSNIFLKISKLKRILQSKPILILIR